MLLRFVLQFIIIALLTIITQIGGILYLFTFSIFKKSLKKRILFFVGLYLFTTFAIIPKVAPYFGREKIKNTKNIQAHSFLYKLLNRNYVTPKLQKALLETTIEFNKKHPDIKVIYLDANFPFINGFPLLPHLSHNDGKKIDISLIYETQDKKLINKKKSVSGYGVFENPRKKEYNQINVCKKKGYWQYDFPKYITLGSINSNINFSKKGTKDLIQNILKQKNIGKLFIEPHLKSRLQLSHPKIRFHGCQAVRHDDHIHLQIK